MMYIGSKRRVAAELAEIIRPELVGGAVYVEPFVGGANMLSHIKGPRVAADSHFYLIALLSAVASGWVPPRVMSYEVYAKIRSDPRRVPPELAGFVGFLCSFGGKWWGGFAIDKRGYSCAARGCEALVAQAPSLRDVRFAHCSYTSLVIPPNSVVYCDPPYLCATGYGARFDTRGFWSWCVALYARGHKVFVSEYSAPNDPRIQLIFQKSLVSNLNKNAREPRIEKLYRIRG